MSTPTRRPFAIPFVALALALCGGVGGCAGESADEGSAAVARTPLRVAVAANAAGPLHAIEAAFERAHPDVDVQLSIGSTGGLTAQIVAGAPYDVFVAADGARPALLAERGFARETRTYARGRLALVGAVGVATDDPRADLMHALAPERTGGERLPHVAIANPRTAPYGAAAVEVLRALGLYEGLADRLALGADVGQAHSFVASGAAAVGVVGLAQARARDGEPYLVVPSALHAPLHQDAALLVDEAAPRAFFAFVGGADARAILAAAGYDVGDDVGGDDADPAAHGASGS